MMTKHERGSAAGALDYSCVVPSRAAPMMHHTSGGSGKGQAFTQETTSSGNEVVIMMIQVHSVWDVI
jgi:hypothetical protein